MSKKRSSQKRHAGARTSRFAWPLIALVAAAFIATQVISSKRNQSTQQAGPGTNTAASPAAPPATNALPTAEVNTALMVTEQLDFGGNPPSIAEALKLIERRHQPDDGQGRTFAILDAYGEPTADKKLHISMHVSMEKPGIGSLIFRPTGKVLWQSRIILGPNGKVTPLDQRSLLILVDNAQGKSWTIDGSNNPGTILDANIKEVGAPLRDLWPDGTEREFTYIYSACGCPVKAMVRRVGNGTVRAKELPVMFPDDPAALGVISKLMGWN